MTDAPSREEFEIWKENPVTRFVAEGLTALASGQRLEWAAKGWAGDLDPLSLERYRTRADAYEGLAGLTYEQALGANGVETPE